jgi:thiol:disulfide interchange protein DsbD
MNPKQRISRPGVAVALLLGALAGPDAALAQARHTRVTLVPETEWVQPGRAFFVGLRLEMDEGWHTYWLNPGDSGLPTRLEWELPEGFAAGEIQWPRPERFSLGPLTSYGYGGSVLLLVEIAPPASFAGASVELVATARWLECEEVCLPGKAPVTVSLPVRESPPALSPWGDEFAASRRLLAADARGWTLQAGERAGVLALSVEPPLGWDAVPTEAWFYPTETEVVEASQPQRLFRAERGFRLEMTPDEARSPGSGPLRGVLVADAGGPDGGELVLSVEAGFAPEVAAAIGTGAPAAAGAMSSLAPALLAAFLGGLILNLMPCVLPVLSLKVLAFVREAGGDPRRAWHHGLAFTGGVLVFFWILAASLLALRAGGEQVGWGFQLQSPGFVAFLTFLFFLIGLNLFGVFEVGTSLTSVAAADHRSGLAGSFWGGALATLVATPCTAPFMGSALGYALAQPAWVALVVFSFLGLGMAFPYLLLSRFPSLRRYVPRPGAWMEAFKQLMGFFIMATVVVLLWVFGRQAGVNAMSLLLGSLVVIGLGAWIYGRGSAPDAPPRRRLVSRLAAAGLVVAGVLLGLSQAQADPGRSPSRAPAAAELDWQPWSEARQSELLAQGRPVFVDFTADWCLTCQVNEQVAFTAEVRDRLEAEGVALLRADWTLRDDAITRALSSHGRQGVPLYVLYGRDGKPRLLPQLLTPGLVVAALDEAL